MSPPTRTHDRCAAVIGPFGYTPRQADFLAYVALHGGYFLRRQYTTYTQAGHGLAAVRFLRRLIERKHARTMPFGQSGEVYHLCARSVYDACALEGRGWGREASWQRVGEAVATLDFTLANPEVDFLVTDADKEAAVTGTGLERAVWPCDGRVRSRVASSKAERIVFDRRPWFFSGDDRRLWLVYAESGSTLKGLRSFLHCHLSLLRGIPSGVVHVSQSTAHASVRDLFSRAVLERAGPVAVNEADFAHYCRVRHASEGNAMQDVSMDDIRRYQRIRPLFSNRHYDDRFRRWSGQPGEPHPQHGTGGARGVDCVLRFFRAGPVAVSVGASKNESAG